MPDPDPKPAPEPSTVAVAPAEPAPASATNRPVRVEPKPRGPVDHLPSFKVLLHNDDQNEITFVVQALVSLAGLRIERAVEVTLEAHETGVALVLTTHRELAELHAERLLSKGLTATIEPA
ncbi:MAG: ATP-dependent Clp protease adaptor ClpS [Phycisphaerales bacterium]|jgi:ATP-dependent Clp protease adapter protein ClpS